MRYLFDGFCAFCALIGAIVNVRVVVAILMVFVGEWSTQEGFGNISFAWASIEAMGQVSKFVGS